MFEIVASSIGLRGQVKEDECSQPDSHRHWSGFKSAASAIGLWEHVLHEMVPAAGVAPALDPF